MRSYKLVDFEVELGKASMSLHASFLNRRVDACTFHVKRLASVWLVYSQHRYLSARCRLHRNQRCTDHP